MVYSDYPIFRGEQQLPIFLLNMGLHLCQDHVVRPEGHSSPQILFCTRGSGTLVISGNRLNVPAGSAIFLPAAFPHEYYANEDVWDIHWVIPGGSAAEEVLRQFGLEQPGVFELSDTRTLEHIFRKMHDAIRADSFFGNFRASGYLYDFLIEFYRLISSGSSSRAPSPAQSRWEWTTCAAPQGYRSSTSAFFSGISCVCGRWSTSRSAASRRQSRFLPRLSFPSQILQSRPGSARKATSASCSGATKA